jgi:hypothetical protein
MGVEDMIHPSIGLLVVSASILLVLGVLVGFTLFLLREFLSSPKGIEAALLAEGPAASEIEGFIQSLTPDDFAAADHLVQSLTAADLAEAERLGRTASAR